MQTRRRSSWTAQKATRASLASSAASVHPQEWLPEVLHLICGRLSNEDIARACSSCKSWALHLRAGITAAKMVLCQHWDNKVRLPPPTRSLSKHSPALNELHLLLGGRSSYSPTAAVVSQISSLKNLQHLTMDFVVSETPKKGSWPMFFSDSLQLGKTPALTIRGSGMPPIAITNLLDRLGSTSRQHLRQLHLLMGQRNSSSQLPNYVAPGWVQMLTPTAPQAATVTGDQMEQLVRLTGLQELVFAPDTGVLGSNWKMLSKLKALTCLQVNTAVSYTVLDKLAALKKLRKLTVDIKLFGTTHGDLREACCELKHVAEVNVGLTAAEGGLSARVLQQEVHGLASSISSNLQGLNVSGFTWSHTTAECLAMLTALTSLQLLQVQRPSEPTPMIDCVDLTPLGKLQNIKRFTLHCDWPAPHDVGLRLRFGMYEEDEQQQCRSSTSRRSSRRHSQQQQQFPPGPMTDISGLFKVWPGLQQLQLSGLTSFSVLHTDLDFSGLKELKSLCLQFCNNSQTTLRMCAMPKQLENLQLADCLLMTIDGRSFGDRLTSLSLFDCTVSSINVDGAMPWASTLPDLLQELPVLQHLELANLHHVDDQVLCQAVQDLTSLESLSIVGIGNQQLTHGALLGLTRLRKLRQLRWHVGDVLDMLPDLSSLAMLKGLMALYVHTPLHTQMERWGGYAVLDSLPFCDVHVEAV